MLTLCHGSIDAGIVVRGRHSTGSIDGAYAAAIDPPLPALVDLPSIDFNMARIWLISERPERGLRGLPDGMMTEGVDFHARACRFYYRSESQFSTAAAVDCPTTHCLFA